MPRDEGHPSPVFAPPAGPVLAEPVPFVKLDTDGVPVTSRFDFFCEINRSLWDVAALTDRKAVLADMKHWRLDYLVLADCKFTNQSFYRDPKKIKGYDTELLLLEFYVEGYSRGMADGTATYVDRRFMQLVDLSRPYRSITQSARLNGVIFPHSAVGYDPSRHPPYRSISSTSPTGKLLFDAMHTLIARLPKVLDADAPALAEGFVNLVRALLISHNPNIDPMVIARARSLSMRIFIEQQINDPDLGVALLCRIFNVSRRTVFRLFEDAGGVDRYIQQRRLHRCLHELQQAKRARGQVRSIGASWGFDNPSHFNRLFRRYFGFAPSDCLGVGLDPPDLEPPSDPRLATDEDIGRYLSWMERREAGRAG